jgi:hypothetical protein
VALEDVAEKIGFEEFIGRRGELEQRTGHRMPTSWGWLGRARRQHPPPTNGR